jgi:hypothetical protein
LTQAALPQKWDGYGVPIPTLAFRWALTRRRSQCNHWESASPIKPLADMNFSKSNNFHHSTSVRSVSSVVKLRFATILKTLRAIQLRSSPSRFQTSNAQKINSYGY